MMFDQGLKMDASSGGKGHRKRPFWRGIQGQIILVLLVSLVPTLLIQGYVFNRWYETRRNDELQANLQLARAMAKTFEGFVRDVVQQEYAVGRAIASFGLSTEQQKRWIEDNMTAYPGFMNLLWISREGNVLVSHLPQGEGQSISDRKYFQDIAGGREWSISDLEHSRATGEPIISIARGIRNNGEELLGIVVASILSDRLDDALRIERSEGGGQAIVDSRGTLVFRHPWTNPTWEQRNWIKDYPEFKEALSGREVSQTVFAALEGKNRLVGFVPISSIGWAASAGRTEGAVLAGIVSQLIPQAAFLFLITLAAFGTAFLYSRSIVNSVKRLRKHAAELGAGDVKEPLVASGPAELIDLADSFNEMAERLRFREMSLRDSRERLRVTLTSIGDGVLTTDTGGKVTFLNPVAAALTGWKPEEAVGRPVQSIFRVMDEKTRAPADDIVERALKEGKSVAVANHTVLVAGDGREIPIEDGAAPIKDNEGNVTGVVLVFHDVTEKRRAQEALHESEKRFRAFVTAGSDVVYRMSPDWSEMRQLHGRNLTAGTGNPGSRWLQEYIHPDDRPLVTATVNKGVRNKGMIELEHRVLRLDGSLGWALSRAIPLFDSNGEIVEWFGAASDVTERKRAEDKIRNQNLILETINQIFYKALTCNTEEELGKACLTAIESLTQSNISFIGEIGADGFFHDLAISNPGWDLCALDDKSGHRRQPGDFKVDGLYGRVLKNGKSLLTNDPYSHPDSIGTPQGHPALTSFLGVPLKQNEKVIGMVGLGNRDGGYTLEHQQAVEAVAPSVIQALLRKRAELAHSSDLAALVRMHDLSGKLLEAGGLQPLLQEIMDAAVMIANSDMGMLQLLEDGSLRIVAAHGHRRPFLDFFASVEKQASVCGEAMRRRERVIVHDVEMGSIFAGTPSLPVMREAGVRAVQSTPMISRTGALLGVLTTQWKFPYTPDEHDLWRIDLLARQAADLIEHSQAEDVLRKSRDELELRVHERTAELEKINQALFLEIEERKRAEEAVKAERQHLYKVLETLPAMVCLLTQDYHIAFANRSFREKFGESHGRHCYEHCFGLSEPCEFCESYNVLKTGQPHHWEFTGPGGSVIDAYDFPFTDVDGSPMILEMDIDITDRRRAEAALKATMAKLEHSNQALQEFASIASHDMKEPLRKVLSFGNMLQRQCKDSLGETGNSYLNRMIDASQRMQTMITSLLDYSRVTANKEPISEIDLYDIVHEVLSDLELKIEKTGAGIQIGELPTVQADPAQMRQLFQNLIGNALKFHKDGESPRIHIWSTPADSRTRIFIEDNGIGFEEQYLDKIFQLFQRLHGRSSQYEGTGIGLAICKKIVEWHGGSITAESTPGEGSRFILEFPVVTIARSVRTAH